MLALNRRIERLEGGDFSDQMEAGNMRHLIVEACISRNLLDTSAYFWPGYVNALSSQVPRSASNQVVGWSSFMKGSPLTPSMVNALVATPASRFRNYVVQVQIKKLTNRFQEVLEVKIEKLLLAGVVMQQEPPPSSAK
ncbi:mediator of RNA polymerase II transcription subunit 33A-like isoform X2 [Cucumis melo var. makuwa]|uniref:Mediator of RNA polymerase II transcription subunit 33A-like isoform X2 n=1 Tax=Cucumis melo var. makuwa TaxID=1194695 RepID=A0A5D3E1U8_CUCMM|nr:mediator of RNA polymerase II transcription subunit 33A-like isoform X2 [Cucumis melo var. makuwa]